MALSLDKNGATYHIIGEQGFHDDDTPPWNHCVLLSYTDGASSFGNPPLATTRFELRGEDYIRTPNYPLGETVLDKFYAFILRQSGWESATVIPDAVAPSSPDEGEE